MRQTRKRKVYDAIVIGSGAAGAMASKELTERSLNTFLLEGAASLSLYTLQKEISQ
jgi:succinate dehydrogenase/fumarate reductase flavoprotein subunit